MIRCAIGHDGKCELLVCEGDTNSAKYMKILKEALLPIFASAHVDKKQHLFMERHKLGMKKNEALLAKS